MLLVADEIKRKLLEIDETIAKINEQKTQTDALITQKLDRVIGEKLIALQFKSDTESFKRQNPAFVQALRVTLKEQYDAYFTQSLAVLGTARAQLEALLPR